MVSRFIEGDSHTVLSPFSLFELILHSPLLIFVYKLGYKFGLGEKHSQLSLVLFLIDKLFLKMCLKTFEFIWFYINIVNFLPFKKPIQVFDIFPIVLNIKISFRIFRWAIRLCFKYLVFDTVTTPTRKDSVKEWLIRSTRTTLTSSLIDHIINLFLLITITKLSHLLINK